jgi:hypothetical protein
VVLYEKVAQCKPESAKSELIPTFVEYLAFDVFDTALAYVRNEVLL